jgi:hypothetical protein
MVAGIVGAIGAVAIVAALTLLLAGLRGWFIAYGEDTSARGLMRMYARLGRTGFHWWWRLALIGIVLVVIAVAAD